MAMELGSLPDWLNVSIAGAALWRSMIGCRREWVISFADLLTELSEMRPADISAAIEGNSRVAEIVGTAWEAAARSGDETKRRLLAKAAAAALNEDDDAQLDELQFMTRTLRDVEPGHVQLLAKMLQLVFCGLSNVIWRPIRDTLWHVHSDRVHATVRACPAQA